MLDRLRSRAATSPDDVCYSHVERLGEGVDITWGALHAQVSRIAHALLRRATPGDRVLLLMPSGIEFVQAFWACLYAGLIAVPLHPPKVLDRSGKIRNIVDDCRPALAIVLEQPTAPQLDGLHSVELVQFESLVNEPAAAVPLGDPSPQTIAFLQYSSGSTGRPKGVMITYRGMGANLAVLETETRAGGGDTFVGWLPLFHDMGIVMMVLMPVYVGARSILLSPARFVRRPLSWLQAISHYRGTISGAPNFAYERCVQGASGEALGGVDLSCWRLALNGAESVRARTIESFTRTFAPLGFDRRAMTPAYGMAEATVFLCAGRPTQAPTLIRVAVDALQRGRAEHASGASDTVLSLVGCGMPPDAHEIRVVRDGAVVAERQVGEIWVRGNSIATGYWGRPEQSEATFGGRTVDGHGPYLRTGDLGFFADGELFVMGRANDVLIVEGRNLFPDDLEACARSVVPADAVGDAVVFSADTEAGVTTVLVMELRERHLQHPCGDVAAHVRAALFESFELLVTEIAFVGIGAILKTSSGKVMRGAMKANHAAGDLRAWHVDRLVESRSDAERPPSTPIERVLASIWSRLLGVDVQAIGAGDNFFALGGRSLLAVRLVAEVREALRVELGLQDLFANATLVALAALIDRSTRRPTRPRVLPVARDGARALPSFAQQRLWFLDRLDAGSARYNLPFVLRTRGRFDAAAAEQALQRIIARHEALRTVFQSDGEQLWQVIRERATLTMPVVDLSSLEPAAREAEARALARADAQAPFDLASGPLLRVRHVRLGEEEGLLLFNMHHIATDGWSMGLLVCEFLDLYRRLRHGQALDACHDGVAASPPASLRYSDYAQWQRDWLVGPVLEEQLAYWRKQLDGLPPVHALPLDRARPARLRFRGARHGITLDAASCQALQALAQRHHATLFMLLHAALSVLLARHGDSSDIVIGTPVANRLHTELEGIIGFFANTLVLRVDVSGNPPFEQLLAQVRSVNLEAQSRQDVPFELLVEHLRPLRSTQYNPLFQVMLSMAGAESPGQRFDLPDVEFAIQAPAVVIARFDLTFETRESPDGLSIDIDYDTDLFDAPTIERLAGHLARLLQGIAAAPHTTVHDLPMLSDAERHHLLDELNGTEAAYSRECCVHELIEAQAERTPDRTAVVSAGQSLSYGQLDRRVRQLARRLRERGVEAESLVGLHVERGIEMVVGMLGILKAGGAYVPLDPTYPGERIAHMLRDARPRVVLTQRSLRDDLPAIEATVLCIDDGASADAGLLDDESAAVSHAQHLAYVIYTSGSTGVPKGVCVSHRNLMNFVCAMQKAPGIETDDVLLSVTSLSFDIAALEIYLPLSVGATTVIASRAAAADPARLAQMARQHRASVMQATPSSWRMLIEAGGFPFGPTLRVLCGGEALPVDLAQQLLARVDVAWNLYGPTETTVWSTAHQLNRADPFVPLGRPIGNTRLYVLDAERRLLPLGACGELHIAGDGVARGYLRRDELTRERFVADPFGPSGAMMYRTGDRVRYRNGRLEYQGRLDQQVKIRGFRVELGEIEERLAAHEEVGVAVVVARPRTDGGQDLVAYVSLAKPDAASPDDREARFKDWVSRALPEFMRPSRVLVIDGWPQTPNGKIDRRALPAPDTLPSRPVRRAPLTGTAAQMALLWASLLEIHADGIDADSNFFALGGHSLMLVRLVSRIDRDFQVRLDIRDAFEMETLGRMSAVIDDVVQLRSRNGRALTASNVDLDEFEI